MSVFSRPTQPKNLVTKHKQAKFFEYLKNRSDQTYDVANLKKDHGNIIPVFIYDGLMSDGEEHHYMKDAMFFGPATTQSDDFVLLEYDKTFLLFPESNKLKQNHGLTPTNFRRVQGELYGIPLDKLYFFDKSFDNGFAFDRIDITVMLHNGKNYQHMVKNVLTYVGNISHWENKVEASKKRFSICLSKESHFRIERVYRALDYDMIHIDESKQRIESTWADQHMRELKNEYDGYPYY